MVILNCNPIIGLISSSKKLVLYSFPFKFQSHYRSDFICSTLMYQRICQNFNPIIGLISSLLTRIILSLKVNFNPIIGLISSTIIASEILEHLHFNPIIGLISSVYHHTGNLSGWNFNPIIGLISSGEPALSINGTIIFQSHYRSDFIPCWFCTRKSDDSISIPLQV